MEEVGRLKALLHEQGREIDALKQVWQVPRTTMDAKQSLFNWLLMIFDLVPSSKNLITLLFFNLFTKFLHDDILYTHINHYF